MNPRSRSASSELLEGLVQHGIDPRVAPALEEFVALFETWNRSINLSAARTPDAIAEHVVDSLAVVPHLLAAHTASIGSSSGSSSESSSQPSLRVLDVGSGGGFPVVIAAACIPTAEFVSLEPVHKKHAFLRTAARTLSLANLTTFAERVEDHDVADYDVAMSRATFDLPAWLEVGESKIRRGGWVLGFEAIPVELPASAERFPYHFHEKSRAIIRLVKV